MYEWWVKLYHDTPPYDVENTYETIIKWGARPSRSENLTELQYAFRSDKNPTRFMNKLRGGGIVSRWGFFYKSQLRKPKRNPVGKRLVGEKKNKALMNLKKQVRFENPPQTGGKS